MTQVSFAYSFDKAIALAKPYRRGLCRHDQPKGQRMKRDMDKVRSLLLALEEEKSPYLMYLKGPLIGGMETSQEMVDYLFLLTSGGYLEKGQHSQFRITWAGHELIDNIRDDEIWRKTKDGAAKLGSWSVKLLADLATGFIKAKAASLGLPLGE